MPVMRDRTNPPGEPSPDMRRVAEEVERYCSTYWHPDRPKPVVNAVEGRDQNWWRQPRAASPGVYVLYSADGKLGYIGKASLRANMGRRLYAHFEGAGGTPGPLNDCTQYVQLIEVSEAHLAPSLEECLIGRLNPPWNALGSSAAAA
jgi:hypothetical protein